MRCEVYFEIGRCKSGDYACGQAIVLNVRSALYAKQDQGSSYAKDEDLANARLVSLGRRHGPVWMWCCCEVAPKVSSKRKCRCLGRAEASSFMAFHHA